jgi:hypothetical protein
MKDQFSSRYRPDVVFGSPHLLTDDVDRLRSPCVFQLFRYIGMSCAVVMLPSKAKDVVSLFQGLVEEASCQLTPWPQRHARAVRSVFHCAITIPFA